MDYTTFDNFLCWIFLHNTLSIINQIIHFLNINHLNSKINQSREAMRIVATQTNQVDEVSNKNEMSQSKKSFLVSIDK